MALEDSLTPKRYNPKHFDALVVLDWYLHACTRVAAVIMFPAFS